jgi:hypothetical protein
MPNAVVERSKAVCGRSFAGIAGSNPAGVMDVCFFECCQVQVSATDRSLVQRNPSGCGSRCVWNRKFKKEVALARVGLLRYEKYLSY